MEAVDGPGRHAPTGSARWWRRAALDLTLRLAALAGLTVILVSGRADHDYFWLAVAGVVVLGALLVPRVITCVIVLIDPGWLVKRDDGCR